MSGTKKIRENVLDSSSLSNPTAKTIINDGKTYYCHPIYTNYGASEDGYIINDKRLIPRKDNLNPSGYYYWTGHLEGKTKHHPIHRIIWEAVNQQIIPEDYQIHHINNDKKDNSIKNLELVTRQQNMIHANQERRGKKQAKKQNVPIKCEVFNYHHIYTNYGANKYGQIYNKKTKRCSIGNLH